MYKRFSLLILLNITIFTNTTYASEVNDGIKSYLVITKPDNKLKRSTSPGKKEVYFMNPRLTLQQKSMIWNYHPTNNNKINYSNTISLPEKVFIGMNGVPVLDQGEFGTCVTFANTAAIDAILGKGDYISQLCNLKLDEYLSSKGVFLSNGWWGGSERQVLNQLLSFGFINKTKQKSQSCGGVTEYPLDNSKSLFNIF